MAALTEASSVESELFENVTTEIKRPAILLIDTSGSVKQYFNTDFTIFEKITDLVTKINATEFRVIFWNSNEGQNHGFTAQMVFLVCRT